MKLILFIFLLNSSIWASCNNEYQYIDKYIPKNLNSVEEIHAKKKWSLLYRKKPSSSEFLSWGKQIYDKSPKLRAPNIQEAQGALDYAEIIPDDSYFIKLGKNSFDRKLAKIQDDRKKYLTDLIVEVQNNKNKIIQSSLDNTVQFLKDSVGYQLANILDNLPAKMKDSYQGLELALQKFYNGMGKFETSSKPLPLKIGEIIPDGKTLEKTVQPLPEVANTPELQELNELWGSIQKQAYKRQIEFLSPTFDLMNTLRAHIDMTKPSSNDPIVLLNNKILESLSKHLDIEVMAYEKGTPFNLDLHEALSVLPNTGLPNNQIVHVAELGFVRKGRELPLKYAKVVVSKD